MPDIEILNLRCNGLQDNHAEILGKSLHVLKSLKQLDITKNEITDASTKELTKGILLSSKLKQFKYDESSFNKLNTTVFKILLFLRDTSSRVFKCVPSNFKAFIFILDCINELSEGYVRLSDIVKTLGCITELDLIYEGSGDKINDESTELLCPFLRWFGQLEIVRLNNNDITAKVTELLVLTMLQIHTFKQLELAGNPIVDSELAVKIFTIILELHEKELQSFTCDENSDHDNCKSVLFIMECLDKIEHPQDCTLLNSVANLIVHTSKCASSCKFVNYINFLPGLQCLDTSCAVITKSGINELSTYLTNHHQLKELDLSSNNLGNLRIHNQVVKRKPLLVARFNNCNVTDEVLHDLINSLVMFSDVQFFELEGNCFGNKGIDTFCSLLTTQTNSGLNTNIASLNLSNNQLDSSSAKQILEIVEICSIRALNISSNHLDSFFPYFEHSNITTLEELDISSNNSSEDNSKRFLQNMSYLSECKALKILNISNNYITETAVDQIYCCFLKCFNKTDLVEIQCICNKNPARGKIEAAFDFVKNLYSLDGHVEVVDLGSCPEAACVFISLMANQHIEVNKITRAINYHAANIKWIDFSNCNLQIDASFDHVLRKLASLEELNLSNNRIKSSNFIHLVTGFLFTRQLKLGNLRLEGNSCMKNKENSLKLEMIDCIRSGNNFFKCLPEQFNIFLFILECLDTIDSENCDKCDVYKKINCLKSLDISSTDSSKKQQKLSSDDVKKFHHFLKHFQSLEVVNMRCNNIKDDAKDCLVKSMLKNSSIVDFDLEKNPIHIKETITTVFTTLKSVREKHNEFDFKDLPDILQAFVELLQYINNFEDRSCDIVENIEHLSLKDFYQQKRHKKYSPERARIIVIGFISHLNLFKKLRSLDLCNTYLTADAICELPGFLCSTKTLKSLDISENNIEAKGAIRILQELQDVDPTSNRPILSIKMTDCNIVGDSDCVEIAKLICNLPAAVISVNVIKGNKFPEKAIKILKSKK